MSKQSIRQGMSMPPQVAPAARGRPGVKRLTQLARTIDASPRRHRVAQLVAAIKASTRGNRPAETMLGETAPDTDEEKRKSLYRAEAAEV